MTHALSPARAADLDQDERLSLFVAAIWSAYVMARTTYNRTASIEYSSKNAHHLLGQEEPLMTLKDAKKWIGAIESRNVYVRHCQKCRATFATSHEGTAICVFDQQSANDATSVEHRTPA